MNTLNHKNKICHLTSVHKRNDIRIFVKECQSLSAFGYAVSLIVSDGLGDEIINSVNIFDVGKNNSNRFIRMTQTIYHVYKKAKSLGAEIYHFHDSELIPVGFALKIMGKKVIYDAHEDTTKQILSKEWLPLPVRCVVSCLFNKFEKLASRFFSAIIAATPTIKNNFSKFNRNTVVINNFPLLEEINLAPSTSCKQKAICYVGGISKMRGIEELVNSLELAGCKLILAGNFFDSAFEKKVRSLKGWSKVDYRGVVSRKELSEIFQSSLAGAVCLLPAPNYIDSQPTKMFEYMSAGIPVIASDFPLWKDVVEGNKCGLCVNPLSSDDVAKAIKYIINNQADAEEMGYNGKQAVINKYNWSKEEAKLIKLYENI